MRHTAKRLLWGAVLLFLFCAQAAGQTPLTCQPTNGAVTPSMRAEGLAERIGDIVLVCSGGTPTAAGSALPQVNITVTLNTNLTSRAMDATSASEAVLTVDEPGSELSGAPGTQLACATPLTGCSITSNGVEPYDGTANHPNVFEGVVSSDNAVTFYGVPLTAPGSFGVGGFRVLRITNIRADAASFWSVASASAPSTSIPTVQATVGIAGSPAIAIAQPANSASNGYGLAYAAPGALIVGFLQFGLSYQTWNAANTAAVGPVSLNSCVASVACGVAFARFTENFATATLPRTVGTQQNVPGTIYNSESGFFSTTLASSNPNFGAIGLADAGTRLKATFQGIPSGAQLWVGVGSAAVLTANEAGPFSQVAASGTIAGIPAAPLTVTNGSATAVWEVTSENPAAIDTYQFPVWVVLPSGAPPSGTLTIQGSFAPNADNSAFPLTGEGMSQTAAYPEPRFTSGPPPNLTVSETHSALVQGESGVALDITVSNTGSATSGEVAVEALLPSGFLAVWSMGGANWSCKVETLVCTTSDSLAQGESYPTISMIVQVAANAPPLIVNYLTVSGGGSNDFTDSDTVTVAPQSPPVLTSISPTQAAVNFASFTLTANGSNFQTGAVILWTPPEELTSALATTFISSTQLQATVPTTGLAGTAEVAVKNPDNGLSAQLPFAITGTGPGLQQPLSVSVAQNGSFSQGQNGATYAVTLYTQAGPYSGGTVTVTDTVTSGLTLVSMAGVGWACGGNTCTRSDALGGYDNSYPVITVTVNVAPNASASQSNSASVTNSVSTFGYTRYSTILAALPVGAVSVTPSSGSGPAQTFVLQYSDSAGAADLSTVYVWFTSDLSIANAYSCLASYSRASNELYLENDAGSAMLGPVVAGGGGILANTQCSLNVRAANVTLSGNTLTLSLPVTFTTAFPGLKNIALYAAGPSVTSNWQNLGAWTVPGAQQELIVSSTHSGNFTQGQNGALYTITVSNAGIGPTLGQVTVVDTLPPGISPVSMAGSGWTCSGDGCQRSDALAGGASYPSITVAVNVAFNASSPQTNSVTVSGGGSASSTGIDTAVIAPSTTVSLAAAPNPSEFGKSVTITAAVNPSSATGLITFYDGVTVLGTGILSGGQAVLKTIMLASGGRSLHAHYSGDGTHGPSNSAIVSQSVQAAPAVTFLPPVSYANGVSVAAIATGDFNGDGNADLAIAGPGPDLRILLGNGAGAFTDGGDYDSGMLVTSIVVGDFNGDGKTDVVAANENSQTINVYLGNGDGTFQAPITPVTSLLLSQIVAADFNGDGKLDLAGVAYPGSAVWVLLGNGDGTFQSPVSYGTVTGTGSLAIADFNGDGKPDIVTDADSGVALVLLGNGDGTFAPATAVYEAGPSGSLPSVTIGDFNGDGKPDIAVATAGSIAVLLGNGDGTFPTQTFYNYSLDPDANLTAIVAADFNGDGFLDLAVTDSVAETVSVFSGNGDGTFAATPVAYNTGGYQPNAAVAGEFNGDGRTDLAVVNLGTSPTTGNNVSVLLGSDIYSVSCNPASLSLSSLVNGGSVSTTCTVTTVPANAAVTANATGGSWLSVQGNGASASPLVIVANPGSMPAGTYTGAITLQFNGVIATVPVTLTIFSLPALSITASSLASFAPSQAQAAYSVTVSNQAPGSQTSGLVTVTETISSGLTLDSIGGTGWSCTGNTCTRADALSAGSSYPPITIILNVAAGATFPQTNSITASGGGSASVTFTFNTGGLPPATVSLTSQANPLIYGQAATLTATVTPSTATGFVTFYDGITVLGASTLSAGIASLSTVMLPPGTGTLKAYYGGDIAHAPNTSNLVTQSVNPNPGGSFANGQSYTGAGLTAAVVADFNGDGKPDLAVIEAVTGSIDILLGDGQGNLQKVASHVDQSDPVSLAVGDFNGDGKVDLAVTDFDGYVTVFLGNGDGALLTAENDAVGSWPDSLVVADFNGDGIADFAFGYALGGVRIFLGNGDGSFHPQALYSASTVSVNLALGDFNGDGKADLAFVDDYYYADVMLGNGDGTFQSPISTAIGAAAGLALAVGDFNGDGKTDAAITDQSGNLHILLSNGDGSLRMAASYPINASANCLTASDFNGDGKADLAVCNSQTGSVSLLFGNGDGSFQPPSVYPVGTLPATLAVADFNGDGRPDIAAVGANGTANINVLLGAAAPALIVFSTHSGDFTLGQSGAAYAITVWNETSQATTGTVTVTDTLPAGLTATAIGGTGWACTLATLTCTRSDALNSGANYPPITVTANVTENAAASVTNQVSVSVGGSATASASDLTSIFSLCDIKQTGSITVADVQLIINEALGVTQAANFLDGGSVVGVVDVQIEINAALGLGCTAK